MINNVTRIPIDKKMIVSSYAIISQSKVYYKLIKYFVRKINYALFTRKVIQFLD